MVSGLKNLPIFVNLVTLVVKLVPDMEAMNVLMPNFLGI
jgi:hypothetical protein